MSRIAWLAAGLSLAGCAQSPDGGRAHGHNGRYQGLGTYAADPLWAEQNSAGTTSGQAATLADDSQIIVIVDTVTGEVRQCGNYSAHCIRMSPLGSRLPIELRRHASDLRDQADASEPGPSRK